MSQTSASSTDRYTGRVKWFNNKAGYGFITITDGPKTNTDVFVHHSAITVDSEQYKYLVQGEYVEFNLTESNAGNHPFQAAIVGGIKNGKLMCETRRELKTSRTNFVKSETNDNTTDTVASNENNVQRTKQRGQGPREEGQWTYVTKTKPTVDAKVVRGRGRPPKTTNTSSTI